MDPDEKSEKRPEIRRDKDGNIPGTITMGDMIDDQDRRKDKPKIRPR